MNGGISELHIPYYSLECVGYFLPLMHGLFFGEVSIIQWDGTFIYQDPELEL